MFTADIPSAFLDRFDCPALVPPAPVPVSIRHITVPFKPYKLLYPRLLDLILPDWYVSTQNGDNDNEKADGDELAETDPAPRQGGTDQVVQGGQGIAKSLEAQDGDPPSGHG
jgi:hypothetical protein